mgnify:FL=1
MKENCILYMVMLGCKPEGRITEQHDIFFGIGSSLKELIPNMKAFWPEAKGKIHIDAWRAVTTVDGYTIKVVPRQDNLRSDLKLFFINLGGYKENEFEEYHYKIITVASSKAEAIKKAKQTSFFKHCGFEGATSHIDDKYGLDVDDVYLLEDLLSKEIKNEFQLSISSTNSAEEDTFHIGYLKINSTLFP